ncbi:MAG TPA: hypothetical protein DHW63_05940 [Hyphomonadaceae bacterium]|nr:hypothetical protein [Hyphomonadaceae bacterium]
MGYRRRMRAKRRRIFLREWRIFRNKTQSQVAEALGVTKTHVSNIENGKRQYTQELLEAAAEYLACDPAHILNVDPTNPQGIWSIWEIAGRIPESKLDDAKKIMNALAETRDDRFDAIAPLVKKRRSKP